VPEYDSELTVRIILHALRVIAAMTAAALFASLTSAAPSQAGTPTYTTTNWSISATSTDSTYGVRAQSVWPTTTGTGAIVGVVDTGILPHADLVAKTLPGYEFISWVPSAGDDNGWDDNATDEGNYVYEGSTLVQASSWHGLHVAGTVVGGLSTGNTVGVAPGAQIVPIRIVGRNGWDEPNLIAAIKWGAGLPVTDPSGRTLTNPNPVDVLNLSLGKTGGCSAELQAAINAAINAGTAVVAAAGNTWNTTSPDAISTVYPANCANVIRVTATDYKGSLTSFSNRGTAEVPATIAAPGDHILSTWNTGQTAPVAGGDSYMITAGTSMAAPHVSGVIALLRSARPDLTVAQLVEAITTSAHPFASSCAAAVCGPGILNAPDALAAALTMPAVTASPLPVASVTPTPTPTPAPVAGVQATAPLAFTRTASPKTTGTYRVGHRLKAYAGRYSPSPAKVTYRWVRNGKWIKKATKASYKVVRADRHKKISVLITITRSGYATMAIRSASHKVH
jgi:serine protease